MRPISLKARSKLLECIGLIIFLIAAIWQLALTENLSRSEMIYRSIIQQQYTYGTLQALYDLSEQALEINKFNYTLRNNTQERIGRAMAEADFWKKELEKFSKETVPFYQNIRILFAILGGLLMATGKYLEFNFEKAQSPLPIQ